MAVITPEVELLKEVKEFFNVIMERLGELEKRVEVLRLGELEKRVEVLESNNPRLQLPWENK